MNQSCKQRKQHVDKAGVLSVVGQCELLQIHRSGLYYRPSEQSPENLDLMRVIDEQYLKYPFYGVPRMAKHLQKLLGRAINKKRVERLYKLMGLEAIGPKPNTSKPAVGHKKYPYLLKNLQITGANHVWAIDITYIPMKKGFMYLVAIIDLHSRYIVGWSISNGMEAEWVVDLIREAISAHGKPEIINSDQGSQFTSDEYIGFLESEPVQIKISMDGKGRAIDNIFIERFWRSLKYEHVYLNPVDNGLDLHNGIYKWMNFYNMVRVHQSIDYQTPEEVYGTAA